MMGANHLIGKEKIIGHITQMVEALSDLDCHSINYYDKVLQDIKYELNK